MERLEDRISEIDTLSFYSDFNGFYIVDILTLNAEFGHCAMVG